MKKLYDVQFNRDISDLGLSRRARNVCLSQNLNNLHDLINYYLKNKTFITIRNCGNKTNNELENIYFDYHKSYEPTGIDNNMDLIETFNHLTPENKKLVKNFIVDLIPTLSIKDRYYFNKMWDQNIYTSILRFQKILDTNKKHGLSYGVEITKFLKKIEKFIHNKYNDDYKIAIFNDFISYCFNLNDSDLKLLVNKISENNFKYYELVNFLLINGYLIDQREYYILCYHFEYYNSYTLKTLKEIAVDLKLSHERIRQIGLGIDRKILSKMSFFLAKLPTDIKFVNYKFNDKTDYIKIDNDFLEYNNLDNKIGFTLKFYAFLTSVLLKTSHNVLKIDQSNKVPFFLINKQFFIEFDFTSFCNDVISKNNAKIKTAYEIPLETYLLKFCKTSDLIRFEKIKLICKDILINNFNLAIDNKDNIIFPANTKKTIPEILVDILIKNDKILNISDLYNEIKKDYGYKGSENSLRGSINNSKEIICFGRTSTYGLRIWEKTKKHIKGGSIRDIVIEFLLKYDEPKHISEIMEYVNLFRKTTESNISSNLKLDKSKRFHIYHSDYIGLNNHNYNINDFKFKSLPINIWKTVKNILDISGEIPFENLISMVMKKNNFHFTQVKYYLTRQIQNGKLIENNSLISLNKDWSVPNNTNSGNSNNSKFWK